MGTCYKGGSVYYRSIGQNVAILKNDYPYANGYFGAKGNSKDPKIRHILSNDPQKIARDFYDKIAYGGVEEPIYSKKTDSIIGYKTRLADGSVISWRNVSSSDGSPAVDVNIERSCDNCGLKQQKIHFVKEKHS